MRAREFFDPFSPCTRSWVLVCGCMMFAGRDGGNVAWTRDTDEALRYTMVEALEEIRRLDLGAWVPVTPASLDWMTHVGY